MWKEDNFKAWEEDVSRCSLIPVFELPKIGLRVGKKAKKDTDNDCLELLRPWIMTGSTLMQAFRAYNNMYPHAPLSKSQIERISCEPVFKQRIEMWQETPNILAKSVWIQKMQEGNYQAAKEWLERMEKDRFYLKNENGLASDITVTLQLPNAQRQITTSSSPQLAGGVSE